MFRGCVAPQVQRLLVGLRLGPTVPSVPPVNSAWQRYKGGPSFMAGGLGASHVLATLHQLDPPMACDILNCDLARTTGAAPRSRQVTQQVSLVVPSRGIRFATPSPPYHKNGRGRLYHHGTDKGNLDTSVPSSCKRYLQTKMRQSLMESRQHECSMPGRPETKQAVKKIRVKLKRKAHYKARKSPAPKRVHSTNHSEDVTYSQKPRNSINHWISNILEKTKRFREELLEGKQVDLGKLQSPEDEAKIMHYKRLYVTQLQRKTSGLRARSVIDNQVLITPISRLSHKHCSKDSKGIIELSVKDPLLYNFNDTEEMPPKRLTGQQTAQHSADSKPRTESKDAKFEEAKPSLKPLPTLDNIRDREESLLNSAKIDTIDLCRAHEQVGLSYAIPYQFSKPKQKDSKETDQPEILNFVSKDQLNNKQEKLQPAWSNLLSNDQMVFGEVKSILMPNLISQNCKQDMQTCIYSKPFLQDNNQAENAVIFNELKNQIHRRLWELSDEESRKREWDGMPRDNDDWKFRVAEMVSKCLLSIQNKMMNGSHIAYQGNDKDIGEIAEEFYKKYQQELKNQVLCASSCKNETGGSSEGTCQIDESNSPENMNENKDPKDRKTQGALGYLNSKQLSLIEKQIDDIVDQCQRIKCEIKNKSANENLSKDNEENFSNKDQNEQKGEEMKDSAEESAENQLVNKHQLKSAMAKLKRECILNELSELIQHKKCLEMWTGKKLEDIYQRLKENEEKSADNDGAEKNKYVGMPPWVNREKIELKEVELNEKCREIEQREICKEIELQEKCKEIEQREKCKEMEQREKCQEMEQREKCKEMELQEICNEMEQREKCKEIELKEICNEMELKEKSEEMEQGKACKDCEEIELREKSEEIDLKENSKEMDEIKKRAKSGKSEEQKKGKEVDPKETSEEVEAELTSKEKEKSKEMGLKKICDELDVSEIFDQVKPKKKSDKTDPKKKCKEVELNENCEEKDLREGCEEMELTKICEEMELKKKCEEMEQREKSEEMEQKEKCEEMGQREKCEEMEQREKCKEMEQREKCAENDKKTNEKTETDDEIEAEKREYSDLRKILLQLLTEICEEGELQAKRAEESKEPEKKGISPKCVAIQLMKKFNFANLKHWYGTINRQNGGSDQQFKRLRSSMGLAQCEEDDLSKSFWTDSLRHLRKLQDACMDRNLKEQSLYPDSKGIFRSETFVKRCSHDTLCGPIPSVCPKLNGEDDSKISLDHSESIFANRGNNPGRLLQSPNLISWTINDFQRLY